MIISVEIDRRDFFAAAAMPLFIPYKRLVEDPDKGTLRGVPTFEEVAECCYAYADAMLEARKK